MLLKLLMQITVSDGKRKIRRHGEAARRRETKLANEEELDPCLGLSLELSDGGASFSNDGASSRIPRMCVGFSKESKNSKEIAIILISSQCPSYHKNTDPVEIGSEIPDSKDYGDLF
ncbi:unnamed protein product [Eruca vesicaria subsp. sativa]|uniref:Uncharacterized protein n=1 Tax=Eruca vesicaria subsp. sativa TaxID=29727 RepID=A0ABC8JH33_ERUVS|nr:unnamed protein product [Eruca vesicaria subsp. sativa]